jgi:hypothetical protein
MPRSPHARRPVGNQDDDLRNISSWTETASGSASGLSYTPDGTRLQTPQQNNGKTTREFDTYKQHKDLSFQSTHDSTVVDTTFSNPGESNFEYDSLITDDTWSCCDDYSAPSSYAASIASTFTVESLASSATGMSKATGYSAVQIATATKALLSVFCEDDLLSLLYQTAIGNPAIGPQRLQRNLRRLIRNYANLLESEATDRLEFLASRLVLLKAGFLAQSITERFQNDSAAPQLSLLEQQEDSSDDGEDKAPEKRHVNEEAFEDLVVFREFLVRSEAFKTLLAQIQAFVIPKPPTSGHTGPSDIGEMPINKNTTHYAATTSTRPKVNLSWQRWLEDVKRSIISLFEQKDLRSVATSTLYLTLDAFFLATDGLLMSTGQLEPALMQNRVRLRWRCVCIPGFCLFLVDNS